MTSAVARRCRKRQVDRAAEAVHDHHVWIIAIAVHMGDRNPVGFE